MLKYKFIIIWVFTNKGLIVSTKVTKNCPSSKVYSSYFSTIKSNKKSTKNIPSKTNISNLFNYKNKQQKIFPTQKTESNYSDFFISAFIFCTGSKNYFGFLHPSRVKSSRLRCYQILVSCDIKFFLRTFFITSLM